MEATGSTGVHGGDSELDALHAELFERSSGVGDLEAGQIEAWVSGLFAAWDDDAGALAFVDFCESRGGPIGAALSAGLAELADEPVRSAAVATAAELASVAPEAVAMLGTAVAVEAFTVRAPFGTSLVIGFTMGGSDEVDHCALAEIDSNAALADLQMAGRTDELLSAETLEEAGVEAVAIEVDAALSQLLQSWRVAIASGVEPGPGILGNQRLLRRRLGNATGQDVALFEPAASRSVAELRDMSQAEIAQANAAALSTLDAAVPVSASATGVADGAWVAVLRGNVAGLTPRERDGLLWLEWADWLGAGIGLLRAGASTPVDGEVLVDYINGCPEVSSTIPANDRDYAIWAFEIALDHLEDAGLVADAVLSDQGFASLRASMVAAWSADSAM